MTNSSAPSLTPPPAPSVEEVEGAIYYLFKHRGWRSRQVDRWTYGADAQWSRHMFVDLLIDGHEAECFGLRDANSSTGNSSGGDSMLVPLFELRKGSSFSSFSLTGRDGKPIKLYDGSKSALLIVSALWGGLAEECDALPPLNNERAVRGFLYELFSLEFPLSDDDGAMISPSGSKRDEKVLAAARRSIRLLQSLSDDELADTVWRREDVAMLDADFSLLYKTVPVFRWFVNHYSHYQLYCARIEERDTSIKCSYQSSLDLFSAGGFHHLFSPFCYFDAPLDASMLSDEGCVTVVAPEGMSFVPNFYPHCGQERGGRWRELRAAFRSLRPGGMRDHFGSHWFSVQDRRGDGASGRPIGIGSLNPNVATFRDVKPRWL